MDRVRFMIIARLVLSLAIIWECRFSVQAQESAAVKRQEGSQTQLEAADSQGQQERTVVPPTNSEDEKTPQSADSVPAGSEAKPQGENESETSDSEQPFRIGRFVIGAANDKQPAVLETAKRLRYEGFKVVDRGTESADLPDDASVLPAVIIRTHNSVDADSLHSCSLRLLNSGHVRWVEIQLDERINPDFLTAKIVPQKATPYDKIADTVKVLIQSGVPNVQLDRLAPQTELAVKHSHSASLIVVDSDWTKSPAAKQIKADIIAGSRDANLSTDLQSQLLESGPQVLFAEHHAALYESKHVDELLAWLQHHKLIQHQLDLQVPPLENIYAEIGANTVRLEFPLESEFNDVKHLLPLPLKGAADELFVQSTLAWGWKISNSAPNHQFEILTTLAQWQKYRGQPEPVRAADLLRNAHKLTIPAGRVAVVRALAHLVTDEDPLNLKVFHDLLRQTGQEPLLIIRSPEARMRSDAQPAFHLPDQVVPYSATYTVQSDSVEPDTVRPDTAQSDLLGAPEQGLGPKLSSGANRTPKPADGATRRTPDNRENSSPRKIDSSTRNSQTPNDVTSQPERTRVFWLKHANAEEFHNLVQQLIDTDRGRFSFDARTNTFIMRAPESILSEIEQLARTLDVEVPTPGPGGSPARSRP